MRYFVFLLCVLSIFTFSSRVDAQMDSLLTDNVNINVSPENPGPNQVVIATLSSYDTNINKAYITWAVNGTNKKSGTGEKTFSFTTGGSNTTTRLNVYIETAEGQTIQKSITLKPSSIDLIWQTESFTPPFYKGKPMFSYENKITFIAMPHITNGSGTEIGAKNLVYTWKLNGSVIESAGGYGKNTYSIVGSIISRPLDVVVEVSGASSGAVGVAEIIASPVAPEIRFYKKSPLYGIEFQNALNGNVSLQDSRNTSENSKEITVIGVPFFFGTTEAFSPELSYTWSINNSKIADDGHQITQVFRQVEEVSGISKISLKIGNENKVLQYATGSFNLQF